MFLHTIILSLKMNPNWKNKVVHSDTSGRDEDINSDASNHTEHCFHENLLGSAPDIYNTTKAWQSTEAK